MSTTGQINNGPNQILEASDFTSISRETPVKLRIGEKSPESLEPISIPALLKSAATKAPNGPALAVKNEDSGAWRKITYGEYLDSVRTTAKAFIKLGLEQRKSVAIIGKRTHANGIFEFCLFKCYLLGFNSIEWCVSDIAAVFADGIATGIYATNSPQACKYIAKDCKANIIVVEDDKQLQKFLPMVSELPDLKAIIQYDGSKPKADDSVSIPILSWEEMTEIGAKETDDELERRLKAIAINQCCHLCYTSGTTGSPKGVMLSHDNLTFTARILSDTFKMKEKEERIVSYLPLSHVAANTTDIFVMMTAVGTVYFADKNALKGTLTATLKEALPTLFLGVPRVWEKIYEKMVAVGKANKGLKKQIGTWAKKTGKDFSQKQTYRASQQPHHQRGHSGNLAYKVAEKVVFSKIKTALGLNKCKRFYSAAAPLSKEVLEYFMSLDIRIWEIYGMSECTGPQLSNTPSLYNPGSLGRTLDGFNTRMKNVEEGSTEIQMKGRNVMMGYLGDADKTRDTFDEDGGGGWLRSGDIGVEDADGFVTITGRRKEILITAGGENVAPVPIEDAIKKHMPFVSNAMVIGDKRKFLSVLLTFKVDANPETLEPLQTLSKAFLEHFAAVGDKKEPWTTVFEAMEAEPVLKAVQEGLDKANEEAISRAAKVQKYFILPLDFSVYGGELGPTLKLKRHVVAELYAKQIDNLYK